MPSPACTPSTPCPLTAIFWKPCASPWAQTPCSDRNCRRENRATSYTVGKADELLSFTWGRSGSTPHSAEQSDGACRDRQTPIKSSPILKSHRGPRKLWVQGNARVEPGRLSILLVYKRGQTKRELAAKLHCLAEHLRLCSEATEQPRPWCSGKHLHILPNPHIQ